MWLCYGGGAPVHRAYPPPDPPPPRRGAHHGPPTSPEDDEVVAERLRRPPYFSTPHRHETGVMSAPPAPHKDATAADAVAPPRRESTPAKGVSRAPKHTPLARAMYISCARPHPGETPPLARCGPAISPLEQEEDLGMMGKRTVMEDALFYEFSIERHVPADHLLRSIDCFVDLSGLRSHLRPFYSEIGRPSIDPELMIRMADRGLLLWHLRAS